MTPKYREIYDVVRRIPRGRVATYAQVARLAGLPGQPRLVGYALAASSGQRLPWLLYYLILVELFTRVEQKE